LLHSIFTFFNFYRKADTKYQVHSPFVTDFIEAVLEDKRWFYAFSDVEKLRSTLRKSKVMLEVADFGARSSGTTPNVYKKSVSDIVAQSASSVAQGQQLFRLVAWLKPITVLELGSSVGISTLYMAKAAQKANVTALEGAPALAAVLRSNAETLKVSNIEVKSGPFEQTLQPTLKALQKVDLVFFDGNHRGDATLAYFEQCLPYVHDRTVFVFDDCYWSEDMTAAWKQICAHPKVRLSIDTYDLGIVFFNPDFKERQHFRLMPRWYKPWKVF
jgi:predicted O-methyltransferase YrrM